MQPSFDDFKIKSISIHGNKYNYSLVDYKNSRCKIEIICNTCGFKFFQRPDAHLSGQGCRNCVHNSLRKPLLKTIEESNLIHNFKYDYSLVKDYTNADNKYDIICNIHGIFKQSFSQHVRQKQGCPKCNKLGMVSELKLLTLIQNNLPVCQLYQNFKPKWLPNRQSLDIYIANYNIAIEHQGEQHFREVDYWGGKPHLDKIQRRDKTKQDICKLNNCHILYFTYYPKHVPVDLYYHVFTNEIEFITSLKQIINDERNSITKL